MTRQSHGSEQTSSIMEEISRCSGILGRARRALVFTGAGISAESGMPTYRGPDGLYSNHPEVPVGMSAESLANEPEKVWKHVDEMRIRAAVAEPNVAHRILAKWEQEERFPGLLIATQNIDGLHQKAGSEKVTELHGSLWQMARPRTLEFTDDEEFSTDVELMAYSELREDVLRRWSEENERQIWEHRTVPFDRIPPFDDDEIRPNIVLYGESYGSRLVWVEDYIRDAPDVILVIGCSGGVTILEQLLRRCRQACPDCEILNINPHIDGIDLPHQHLSMPASLALSAIESSWVLVTKIVSG